MEKRAAHNLFIFFLILVLGAFLNPSVRGAEKPVEGSSSPIASSHSQDFTIETEVTPLMTSFINSDLLLFIQEENFPKKEINLAYKNARLNPDLFRPTEKLTGLKLLESTLYTSSIVSLVALNVADYYSTVTALKYDGVGEANPLMKPFTKNKVLFAAVKLGLTAYNVHFMRKLHKKNKGLAWAVSLLANFALSYVVVNNMKIIDRARSR